MKIICFTTSWSILFFLFLCVNLGAIDFSEELVFESIASKDQAELYQLLVVDKVDPNNMFTKGKETPLHYASYLGEDWAVRMLLSVGAKVNTVNSKLYTALHFAAQGGFSSIIQMLLASGANTCMLNQDGFMPIHMAASLGKMEAVKILSRSCQKNVDIGGIDGITPLDLAAQNGFNEVVLYLVSIGANPNAPAKNSRGRPLHFAVHGSHPDTVRLLLDHGAQVNATNDTGDTPFTWNGYIGNVQTARILLAAGADPKISTRKFQYQAIHTASIRGKEDLIRFFLEQKVFTGKEKSGVGAIPLHYASLYGHLKALNILVGVDGAISSQDIEGNTPLHYAISNHQKASMCFLLANGADPGIRNRRGQTSMSLAEAVDEKNWIPILNSRFCSI